MKYFHGSPGISILLIMLASLFFVNTATGDTIENQLVELRRLDNGFLERTGGDPFVVFPEISKSTCSPHGVLLSFIFTTLPEKPLLMEIFWETDYLGFGEENKVFFILHPKTSGHPTRFIVPLDHTAGFRKIRLDLPATLDTSFKILEYDIVPLNDIPAGVPVIDAYYSLSIDESLKAHIIIPYLLQTIKHGLLRIAADKYFMTFWLLLISSLLYLIRKSAKPSKP